MVGEEYSMRLLTLRNVHVKAASGLHLQSRGEGRERPSASQGAPRLSATAQKAFTQSPVPPALSSRNNGLCMAVFCDISFPCLRQMVLLISEA